MPPGISGQLPSIPDQKLLFEGMADEELAHSRMILCVLEKRL